MSPEPRSPLQQAISLKCNHQMAGQKPYLEAAAALREALLLTDSIDDTLNLWRNNEYAIFCGKVCIINVIAEEESNSWLMPDAKGEIEFERLRNTWYYDLFSLLQVDYDNLQNMFKNLSVIDFNYDRCLQQYLLFAISKLYPKLSDPGDLVSTLKVIKSYGSLGLLPSSEFPAFGKSTLHDLALIQRILTYSEQVNDNDILNDIAQAIDETEKIVFVGFALHEQNVKLLGAQNDKTKSPNKRLFGSVYQISSPELSVKLKWLVEYIGLPGGGDFINLPSHDMMRTYRLSIAQ